MGSAKVMCNSMAGGREESRYFLILLELEHGARILGVDILPPSVRGFYLIFYC